MNKHLRKAKKMDPIVSLNKELLEEQNQQLKKVRQNKISAVSQLKEKQNLYLREVEVINKLRQNGDTKNLSHRESGIDYLKQQWFELFNSIKILEKKEKEKLFEIDITYRKLKGIQDLQKKHLTNFKSEYKSKETKEIEEIVQNMWQDNK